MTRSQDKIKLVAEAHFKVLSKDQKKSLIGNQLKVLEHFPSFFTKEEGLELGKEITIDEVQKVLSKFSKDKILGPDGWSVDFFLDFFDILGKYLLDVAELSRKKGYMSSSLNAAFITLIPKNDSLKTFSYFRLIALCNLVYKW